MAEPQIHPENLSLSGSCWAYAMAYSFLYRQRHRRVHRFPSHVSHWNGKERVTDEIGLFEAIYSQRQFTRYKAEPVPREALDKIIDAATKAPNGGNTQPWEFIVLTDREIVTKVGELYQYGNRVSCPTSVSRKRWIQTYEEQTKDEAVTEDEVAS